jgi:ABC-type uncharacterized transport system involved in gliding motility auxiliary subunit
MAVMNSNLRKFAPFGLYFALLAALVSLGLYIVFQKFDLPLQISLACVILGLAANTLLDPQGVRAALTGRQARYGSNAVVLTIAVFGIVVVANVLVLNTGKQWDLTEDKQNTLAKESVDALKSLKAPVKAEAYFTAQIDSTAARDLLDSYKSNSAGKFTYEFIDPTRDPVRAQNAKVTRDGTIVLTESGRTEQILSASEQDLTNGLIRVDNPGTRKVYFLIGHDEYNPDDTSDRSYSSAKQNLVNKNYGVGTLNLLAERKIPDDAKAIIIAGPNKPLAAEEVDLIKAYLEKGGGLVLLSEPIFITQFGTQPDLLAAYLESSFSIKLGSDLVIDPNYNPISVAVAAAYGQHVITQKMNNLVTIFPTARSVQPAATQNPDVTDTPLVSTAQNSWGETSKQELTDSQVKLDQGQDLQGPVNLATSAENTKTTARVVVIGDSDFASNTYFDQYGNSIFLMNAIDWAAKQDDLINLSPKQNTQRIIALNSTLQMGLILLVTILVIPGAGLVTGIASWLGRRRKG